MYMKISDFVKDSAIKYIVIKYIISILNDEYFMA